MAGGRGEGVVEAEQNRSTVLLVEDNSVISLTLAEELEDLGYEVAGPLGAASDALGWLQTHTPDVAVLDAMLRDGLCIELAQDLKRRNVPFLVYSGHRHLKQEPTFAGVPWVEKPSPFSEIAQLLITLRPAGSSTKED